MRSAALLALLVLLTGCVGGRARLRSEAEAIGRSVGLRPVVLKAGGFRVLAMERGGPPEGVLRVYIEGDGRAWITRWQASSDPTPSDPVGLRLAAADQARPLIYLARPCQYVSSSDCRVALWTGERLSPAVVKVFQQLIDDAKRRTKADRVGLVGYSGGGALAALIAERRDDVDWLVTVAADLDLAVWVRIHDLDPLAGSTDPALQAARIGRLPQTHFVGANDSVVPPDIAASFVSRLPPQAPARIITVEGFDHGCCWAAAWRRLLAQSAARSISRQPPAKP
jgi:pimeloyl-ACP methyl ester carboxylesterase